MSSSEQKTESAIWPVSVAGCYPQRGPTSIWSNGRKVQNGTYPLTITYKGFSGLRSRIHNDANAAFLDRSISTHHLRWKLRRTMKCQEPCRPQLMRIAVVLGLVTCQRHQPGFGLRRDRGLLARSRTIIEGCQRTIGQCPLDTALHRLMMDPKSLAHCAKRRILPIRQQQLRPRHPARQFGPRPRKRRQGRNLLIAHCQLDRAPPANEESTNNPSVPPTPPLNDRRFHGIGRLDQSFGARVVTNRSNNYGPYRFPEELVPRMIISGIAGRKLPIYGVTWAGTRAWKKIHSPGHVGCCLSVP